MDGFPISRFQGETCRRQNGKRKGTCGGEIQLIEHVIGRARQLDTVGKVEEPCWKLCETTLGGDVNDVIYLRQFSAPRLAATAKARSSNGSIEQERMHLPSVQVGRY